MGGGGGAAGGGAPAEPRGRHATAPALRFSNAWPSPGPLPQDDHAALQDKYRRVKEQRIGEVEALLADHDRAVRRRGGRAGAPANNGRV